MLVAYGLTNIVVNENIFYEFRVLIYKNSKFLYNIVSCPTCFGFWAGLLVSFFINLPITELYYFNILIGGIISSGINNIIDYFKGDEFKIEEK